MKQVFIAFLLAFPLLCSAAHFTQYGSVETISYRPANSPLDFEYDVVYFIPESLRGKKNLRTLVFLHGGGGSTQSREGSLSVANQYVEVLKEIAEKLGFVLIAPSGSGLNWGPHMLNLLKQLNQTIRLELPVDPNAIALAGHSMGGMGITRSAPWLTDEYAFFLPMASGMDEKLQTTTNLRPFMNMVYYQLQGINDHFRDFIDRNVALANNLKRLSIRYKKDPRFYLEFYEGGHNFKKELVEERLSELFLKTRRNLYQSELYGMFYNENEVVNDNSTYGKEAYLAPRDRYFWLKIKKFNSHKKAVKMYAAIRGNVINVHIEEGFEKFRIYLSHKMLDLKRPVRVIINGKKVLEKIVEKKDLSQELAKDPGFEFESYLDFKVLY